MRRIIHFLLMRTLAPIILLTGGSPRDPESLRKIVEEMTEAIARDPNDAQAYFRRGNAYSNLREYENTKADMDRAIALDPTNSMAFNNRGIAFYIQRKTFLYRTECDSRYRKVFLWI